MNARIADALSYSHLWGTEELRDVFSERPGCKGGSRYLPHWRARRPRTA